ncbi:MAG: hypothetical protein ACLQVF_20060 [Isosphaeraceae bacterium]
MAQIVQARATSKSALEQVVGVGDGRVGKYGERILEENRNNNLGFRVARAQPLRWIPDGLARPPSRPGGCFASLHLAPFDRRAAEGRQLPSLGNSVD